MLASPGRSTDRAVEASWLDHARVGAVREAAEVVGATIGCHLRQYRVDLRHGVGTVDQD